MNAYHRATVLDQGKEHGNIVCDIVWNIKQEWLLDLVIEAIQVENEGNFQAFDAFFSNDFVDHVPIDIPIPNNPDIPLEPSQDEVDEAAHRVYVIERR